jgi:rod shape determining protein RodA
MADFQRFAPEARAHLKKGPGLWVKLRLDPVILVLVMVIMAFGLMVLYSGSGASEAAINKQLIRYGAALFAMIFVTQISLRNIQRWAPLGYLLGLALLLSVLFFGVGAKGAQRWLDLPGLPRFQPSEVMKLIVPITVAWYLASRPRPPLLVHILVALALVVIPVLLIAKQPDLGTALLVASSGFFVIFFAGILWRYLIAGVVLGASGLPLLWMSMREYQQQRVLTFLDPESDPLGAGWNIIQSKIAIGSGGINGKGWLQGTQSHLDFLPETHTDFIVAVLAEEFGLIGVCLLLGLYFLVLVRGLMIAANAAHPFDRMLAASLTLTFFVYVMVNIGMVSGLLPVVGVQLPLVSYGGTSAVTLMVSLGFLMSIHARRPQRT